MDEPPHDGDPELPAEGILEGLVEEEDVESTAEKVADRAIRILTARFSGPLPPPGVLAAYEDLTPGLAKEIVDMAKTEQAHRHQLEDRAFQVETTLGKRGQVFGFIVALAGLAAAVWLGIRGQQVAASVVGGLDLVGLVAIFLVRTRPNGSTQSPPPASN